MSIFTYIKSHLVLAVLVTVVAVVGMTIIGRIATTKKADTTSTSGIKQVTLVPASSFRSDASTVTADGTVESVSQVDLKSQTSAPLSAVNVSVGDSVTAGQVIAELQNADIRAQLDQAKATLSLAQGQYQTGSVSLDSARRSALDKVRDAYIKADDIINTQIDQFLFGKIADSPQLSSLMTDWRLGNTLSIERTNLTSTLYIWKTSVDSLSTNSSDADISEALNLSQKSLGEVSDFLDNVSLGLSNATKSASATNLSLISSWKAVTTAARSTISAAAANITAAQATLANAQVTHDTPATAQISSAEAGVKNLQAQLAKTIITSPISGKIAALPLRSGELATPGQLIATVVGSGNLQVTVYVSSEDFSRIQKGAQVLIKGTIPGTVTSVAPSVNEINKKVEVKIAIADSAHSGLVVGESVRASIAAPLSATSTQNAGVYHLPIQDVKIIPGNAFVFTVDENSKIKSNPVVLGTVNGDFIEVKSGITDDMQLVSPVYELNEGEVVGIQ